MLIFIIMVATLAICYLIFGNADHKRDVLQKVGLDLSEDSYRKLKEKEFEKNCLKALNKCVDEFGVSGINENDFTKNLSRFLWDVHGGLIKKSYVDSSNCLHTYKVTLDVPKFCSTFVKEVVQRRLNDLNKNEYPTLLSSCDFKSKSDLKKYIKFLWEEYQYPWPENWLQNK